MNTALLSIRNGIRICRRLFTATPPAIFILTATIFTSGCVSILDATREEPIQIDPGKRSFGGYMDDKQLKTVISVNIKKADPKLKDAHINVHTYNAVVLLTGEVENADLRRLAADTARKVNKVRQVYNELSVGPKTTFLSRTNDNWIHSRIKSKLVFNTDIDSDRVEIIVEDNVVYLMGKLTKVQAEKITEVVRTSRGVDKVVRAIEYIE
ncbi:MAG: BON domain-containing protein [Agarilytica sp.]